MSRIAINHLLRHAADHQYAVGYFESWNLESLLAVIDAAEAVQSPVMIGVNGTFIGNQARKIPENVYHYGALCRTIAEQATVPVALLFNEADKIQLLIQALHAGFDGIMFVDEQADFQETLDTTTYLAKTAHYCGAYIEGEVGKLPDADRATGTLSAGVLTDPDQAAFFVEHTGVDALAVSVGNVHLLEGRKARLDFDLIRTLRRRVRVPLVVHGATGIADDDLREAISLGMCKINVGTALKRVYLNVIRAYLSEHDIDAMNPHEVLGMGGEPDMLSKARDAIAQTVIRYMQLFGSEQQARQVLR